MTLEKIKDAIRRPPPARRPKTPRLPLSRERHLDLPQRDQLAEAPQPAPPGRDPATTAAYKIANASRTALSARFSAACQVGRLGS